MFSLLVYRVAKTIFFMILEYEVIIYRRYMDYLSGRITKDEFINNS